MLIRRHFPAIPGDGGSGDQRNSGQGYTTRKRGNMNVGAVSGSRGAAKATGSFFDGVGFSAETAARIRPGWTGPET